jgi:endonuclease III
MPVERAWRAPLDLQARLGHLDPHRIVADPDSVMRAITMPPNLHHFGENIASWIVAAAIIVCDQYDGDVSAIWQGNPTARDVQDRLEQFPGIGQAKAAMAVQMLCRECEWPIRDVPGSDAAYDVHVRRVLLRTGLANVDELDHMRAVVRSSDPTSGAGIALPAWQVGRTWCRPRHQQCHSCPLSDVCPRRIGAAAGEATLERSPSNDQASFAQWVDGDCA